MIGQFIEVPGLILPTSSEEHTNRYSVARRYVTYEELSGEKSSIAKFVQILSTLRRSDAVRWVSTLMHSVAEGEGQTFRIQLDFARQLLPRDYVNRIIELPNEEESWIIFHRRQLWLLLQFSMLVCTEDVSPERTGDVASKLGLACLMASDLLHQIEDNTLPPPESPETNLKWLVSLLISISEPQASEDYVARGYSFWFDSLSDSHVQAEMSHAGFSSGFDEPFLKKFGVAFTDFFNVTTAFYSANVGSLLRNPIRPVLVDTNTWGEGSVSKDLKDKVLSLLSTPIDDIAGFLLGRPRQSWATDYSLLVSRPVIQLFPNQYVCPDLCHMRKFLIDGMYFLLEEAIGKKNWGNIFGAIYEWYLHEVMRNFAVESSSLVRTLYCRPTYKNKDDQVCDALMMWERVAVLFEFKGTRLTTRAMSGIDFEETSKAIENSIASKSAGITQLSKNIARIIRNESIRCGDTSIELSNRKILPVLVWLEEVGVTYATRLLLTEMFDKQLRDAGVQSDRIGPLLLLSTREIELLDLHSCNRVTEDILLDYSQYVAQYPRDPASTFSHFARNKYGQRPHPECFIARNIERVVAILQKTYAKKDSSE